MTRPTEFDPCLVSGADRRIPAVVGGFFEAGFLFDDFPVEE